MSAFFGNFWNGLAGWWNGVAPLDPHAAPAQPEDVKPAEPIDRSQSFSPAILTGMMLPGFDDAPPPSIALRWRMKQNETIALAHRIVTGPIIAGKAVVAIKDDKGNQALAERMKKDAEADFIPRVMDWLPGALECLHFGHWLQEVIWDRVDGRTIPVGFMPVMPGIECVMYKDATGRFSGYQYRQEYRDKRYGFNSVNDEHIDPIFGYSRNDAARRAWWRYEQSDMNADREERKAGGMHLGIGLPTGASFKDDNNNPVISQDMAQAVVDAITRGVPFQFPTVFFNKATLEKYPELAKLSLIDFKTVDLGNIGPALMAHLARMSALEVRMMRAWQRPEREAMAGKAGGGTNAESETQGEIGTTDSELVGQAAYRQFSRQVVDCWRVTNYGPNAPVLALEMAPLSDPQQKALQDLTKTIAQNTSTGDELLAHVALRPLLERVEVPLVPEDEANKKIAQMQADKAAKAQQMQQPPMNGDGANGVPAGVNGNGQKNGSGKGLSKLAKDTRNFVRRMA